MYKMGRMIPSSQSSEEAQGPTHSRSFPKVSAHFLNSFLCTEASVQHVPRESSVVVLEKGYRLHRRCLSSGLGCGTWSKLLSLSERWVTHL